MANKRVSEKEIVVSASAPVRHKPATPRRPRTSTAAPAAIVPESAVPETAAPPSEKIAHLAYSYWEARGYQGGSPEEDWLRAEKELRAQTSVG